MFNLALTHRTRSIIEKNSYAKIELLLLVYALINAIDLGTIFIDIKLFQKIQNLLKKFERHDQNLTYQFEIYSSRKIKLLFKGNLPSKENDLELQFYFHSISLRHVPKMLRNIGVSINKIGISLPRQKSIQLNFSREHRLKIRHKKKLYQGISLREGEIDLIDLQENNVNTQDL
ncbi:hypothetical protein GLOIN_2v1489942 [Rhizophagus irregularis DAOM 181602=DAOM 197198]|uniref:Uncharacterized protein n=1 Tax=Rhizophagus irregularis (strain DAOM 181602 / DAOM 197198 / MUCL 43194) TaxID=747089 RepID=U9T7V0_RHIID|nr:hypothetical protein GLOIN_2v1489942 [Rhizophagus irregularis DAOM 181602=DAOM 197198]